MRVLFVCSTGKKEAISSFIESQGESLRNAGILLDFFTIDRGGWRGYWQASLRLRRYLRTNTYDILHAHYGLSALAVWLARRKEKIVTSFMGDDIVGSNRADGSVTMASALLARFNILMARLFYDHAIVKSDEMLNRVKIANVTLIPNGVDLQEFQPGSKVEARARLGMAAADKIVIFVSHPARVEKNFPLAERGAGMLKIPMLKLVPVFDKPRGSLPDYYRAADVLLLTSFHEGSPNVVKEGMACNCPIVATDVGDVRRVFGGTEGCFLTSRSTEDVANKLASALNFAEKLDRTKGRDRIIELGLDTETSAGRVIEVYQKVLN